jgi:hypothetical protein
MPRASYNYPINFINHSFIQWPFWGSPYTKSRPIYFTKGMSLLGVNLTPQSPLNPFLKFLNIHSREVILLWFSLFSSHYQIVRQTPRGKGFGGEVKGASSLSHKGKQLCPLLVTWTWSPGQELHLHRVLTCFVHLQSLPSQGFGISWP